ncbi:pyruvate kinase [Clostridium oryzae]|uniref:Pyruvate kinase n=1 Tax=Clostridium oryzae TaxID=1450648 RepID=A0A1V4IZ11_9CLOT|nr:pyruvate kinase [Clostridium oryzae]OPJ65133.1 pyruvate kinase [Clostridium oryzae]
MRKTKMICTIGPASEKREILKKVIEAGMNASRHNFSHGDHEEHGGRIRMVQELRKELNKPIAIILDTKGPEIRTGDFEPDKLELKEGDNFSVICEKDIVGDKTKCTLSYKELYKDVVPGNMILIDDGLVGLEVKEVAGKEIKCVVKNSGVVGSRKGVNVPGVSIQLPAITEKDISDLKFGVEIGVDAIAASFVRKASDVLSIRKVLHENGGDHIKIFSKVENQEGVDNIDDIIKFSDGVMVARGDMGVEIPIEKVPLVQKMIIEKCNAAGKLVITATQMLDSMIRNPRPTRAEASDIANAIFDGTDCIMLSGETANGKYPVEAATTMAKIAEEAEKQLNYEAALKKKRKSHVPNVPNAISLATCNTASELNASAIITVTQSGQSAKIVSKYRPECPIVAVTPHEEVARGLAFNWGVFPVVADKNINPDELIDKSVDIALERGLVSKGDLVVVAAGIPVNYVGSTNMLKVQVVGDILVSGKGEGTEPRLGTVYVAKNAQEVKDIIEEGSILVVDKLDKSYEVVFDRVAGIIAEDSSVPSDVTIACMKKEIPLISGAENATKVLKTGSFVTMDVARGVVFSGKANVK